MPFLLPPPSTTFGNISTADPNNHTHYLIERAVQALDYNDTLGQPNWASWSLTAADLGDAPRSSVFFVETNLPATFYRVGTGEYARSAYDRGHLCPSPGIAAPAASPSTRAARPACPHRKP